MWMEAANILNNESRIADKDDPQVEVWAWGNGPSP
jgi:hypothetical protein